MSSKNKRVKIFFLAVYIFIILTYLLTCLIPFLNPGTFWFIALLGLGFPFLLVLVIVCAIIAATKRSKWLFLSLAALLLSYQQISVVLGFRFKNDFDLLKPDNSLRVLSWNVSRWTEGETQIGKDKGSSFRNLMMDAVQMTDADVLCFQEFFECYDASFFASNIAPLKKMGYNYYFFSPASITGNGIFQTGLIILSKYSIVDSSYFKTISEGHSEGFSYASIKYGNQSIRFFNTHLESMDINRTAYGKILPTETSRTIASKLKRSYYFRSEQANKLREEINHSPYPVIFCGDVDDIPNSYTYFKIKGDMQDAFLKKGLGFGRTYQFISPTLRIDYMMADKKFKIEQFSKLDYKYSEHYPLVMDISFSN
jgi:endonuclease/exonuclease/phosphatase family metal-dependent hydrolase